jgi:murein DD-endopeptidase MepM/ murein hydrolase activator NlpD
MTMKIYIPVSIVIFLYLSACSPATENQGNPTLTPAGSSISQISPTISSNQPPLQTSIPLCPDNICPTLIATPTLGTTSESPLQLVLPQSIGEPVSGWRPPLYPAPWAVSPVDHFYFARPIAANNIDFILPDYRYGGLFQGTDIVHTGIDIPAEYGTPVVASASGTVVWAGYGLYSQRKSNTNDPYGQAIVIRHDFGYQGKALHTVYAHLSEIDVAEGQWVETGQQIGLVGNTGFTTGPHLHFEVRVEDDSYFSSRNPELWLVPPQGWGVLVGSVLTTYGALHDGQKVFVQSMDNDLSLSVFTYGKEAVHPDDYYGENLVLSDLPAGRYRVFVPYLGSLFDHEVVIAPGQVTYFKFKGFRGFYDEPPPIPGMDSLTPTP